MKRRYGSGTRTRPDQLAPSTPSALLRPRTTSPDRRQDAISPIARTPFRRSPKRRVGGLMAEPRASKFLPFPIRGSRKDPQVTPPERSGEGWRPGVCRFIFFPTDARTPFRQGVTQQAWRQGVRSGGDSPPPCHRTAHPGTQVPGANATPRSRPRIVAESPRSPSNQRGRVPTVWRWPFRGGGGQP